MTTTAQLQKYEDAAPESLEFERLKEHFEPFLRASASTTGPGAPTLTPHAAGHANPITAAAASALHRDVPGVARYTPHRVGGTRRDRTGNKDEMPEYRSRLDIATSSLGGGGGGDIDVDFLRRLESVEEVAPVDSRWRGSWAGSLRTR
jgi:dynactin-4